jgi:hypothetical protein
MNPNSGPGSSIDPNYLTAIQQSQSSGITIIGYVHTSYGTRDTTTVLSEIDDYYTWYSVDGIFLDEVASSCTSLPYYTTLYDFIKTRNGLELVVLNPGIYPGECYMSVADVVVVFEDTYANYLGDTPPAWVSGYPRQKFWHIVHSASSSANMANAIQLAQQRHAGRVYITDDTGANPYDALPSYWTTELQTVDLSYVPVRLSRFVVE